MVRYHFYEVRSARSGALDVAPGDAIALRRTSYSCAERPDFILFVWRRERGEVHAWQLLFGERFVEWSAARGLEGGETDRLSEREIEAQSRQQGVRTLRRAVGEAALEIIEAGRKVLRESELPDDLELGMGLNGDD